MKYEGQVPGCVQTDLMDAGVLPDPFVDCNETLFYALEDKDFIYQRTFSWDGKQTPCWLVFEGIDTVADVFVNDVLVGHAENMFVQYAFDVTKVLQKGENRVEVTFLSIPRTAQEYIKQHPSIFQYTNKGCTRKAQYAFGWDWGPRLLQVGIWKDVYLSCGNEPAIEDVYIAQKTITQEKAEIAYSARILNVEETDIQACALLVNEKEYALQVKKDVQGVYVQADIVIENPHLWWPAGYGEPNLYDFTLFVKTTRGELRDMAITGVKDVQIQQEKDERGESFTFVINGVKIFAKGVNWIPAHSFTNRIKTSDYTELLQMAKDANCNMVRIWGGGIYEFEAFYETCDKLGLMVWQDFMFACDVYPDENEAFVENVKTEAVQNIKRLRNHASLVLWCGNNECNVAMRDWWNYGDPQFGGNYLYKEVFKELVAELHPHIPYHIASPYGGSQPNSADGGDKHTWNVWSGWRDIADYLYDKGRFISEFGFQAMPCYTTLQKYLPQEALTLFSPMLLCRNKQLEGHVRLFRYMIGRVGLPHDVRGMVHLTQFIQMDAVKLAVEHYRRNMRFTSGALYWQLNDCWPVASWSSVDYEKRRKGLYFGTKRMFAQYLPMLMEEDERLNLYIAGDALQEKQGTLRVCAYRADGKQLFEQTNEIIVEAQCAKSVWQAPFKALGFLTGETVIMSRHAENTMNMLPVDTGRFSTVFFVELVVDGKLYRNHLILEKPMDMQLPIAQIKTRREGSTLILSTETPVFCCVIESDQDVSDNYFAMAPNKEYAVSMYGANKATGYDVMGFAHRL